MTKNTPPSPKQQTNKQASKQASTQASKQANKQTNKQASKQASKQTNKQTNKESSTSIAEAIGNLERTKGVVAKGGQSKSGWTASPGKCLQGNDPSGFRKPRNHGRRHNGMRDIPRYFLEEARSAQSCCDTLIMETGWSP